MKDKRIAAAGLLLAFGALIGSPAEAQRTPDGTPRTSAYELAPAQPGNDIVAPFFDGWLENPDGSYTLSFGFLNRNLEEEVEIPLGPNNFIEPAELDGIQPTFFPTVRYGGFANRHERGAFAVVVPAGFQGDVVWTLTHSGQTYSVPGRVRSDAYEMGWTPQAGGSLRPHVWFEGDESVGVGPEGTTAPQRLTASVGEPVELRFFAQDRGERDPTALNMTWQRHQGPAPVEFEPRSARLDEDATGEAVEGVATAIFSEPGEYVLRVRVDNFTAGDSNFGNACCWTNGYVAVTVTP